MDPWQQGCWAYDSVRGILGKADAEYGIVRVHGELFPNPSLSEKRSIAFECAACSPPPPRDVSMKSACTKS